MALAAKEQAVMGPGGYGDDVSSREGGDALRDGHVGKASLEADLVELVGVVAVASAQAQLAHVIAPEGEHLAPLAHRQAVELARSHLPHIHACTQTSSIARVCGVCGKLT